MGLDELVFELAIGKTGYDGVLSENDSVTEFINEQGETLNCMIRNLEASLYNGCVTMDFPVDIKNSTLLCVAVSKLINEMNLDIPLNYSIAEQISGTLGMHSISMSKDRMPDADIISEKTIEFFASELIEHKISKDKLMGLVTVLFTGKLADGNLAAIVVFKVLDEETI